MRKSFVKIYSKSPRYADEDTLQRSREYLGSEQVDFEGRAINKSVYKVDDPKTRYKGLRGVDFSLENQILVGADLDKSVLLSPSMLEIERQIPKI